MPSIVGVKYADELYKIFPDKGKKAFQAVRLRLGGRYHRIQLTARRAWRNERTSSGRRERMLTGGALVECHVHTVLFMSPTKTIRLKAGWDISAFKKAVQRLLDWALREHHRQLMAEQVSRASDSVINDENFAAAVDAEEKRLGRTSDYGSMSVEDAEHWLAWLAKYKG